MRSGDRVVFRTGLFECLSDGGFVVAFPYIKSVPGDVVGEWGDGERYSGGGGCGRGVCRCELFEKESRGSLFTWVEFAAKVVHGSAEAGDVPPGVHKQ